MSRDKQIEEMTCKDNCVYYEMCYRVGVKGGHTNPDECTRFKNNAGYRRASEVAREIFEEIDKMLDPYGNYLKIIRLKEYIELKKKYTEGGE